MKKKIKGFTLIELIVVIAIIGVLAAILVPSMIGYLRQARAAKINANARSAYSAAQAAISDAIARNNVKIVPDCLYVGKGDGIAHPRDEQGNNIQADDIYVGDYLGDKFVGHFAFKTDIAGSYCAYALWCDTEYPPITTQLTYDEVIDSLASGSPVGCHPVKPDSIDDN